MDFKITDVGIAAALNASSEGPWVRISSFKVGSSFNYTPSSTQTELKGTILHEGPPIAYQVVDGTSCEFTLELNETVGTWQFGEIGIYMYSGELFAVGTLKRPQWKVAYPDTDFNTYRIKVRIYLSDGLPKIELVATTLVAGIIYELPSVEDLPLPLDALTNAYLCHSQDNHGNDGLCTLGEDRFRWTIHSHLPKVFEGKVQAVGADKKSLTNDGISKKVPTNSYEDGKYLVQWLSGKARGQVRRVLGVHDNTINWGRPEHNYAVGDNFEILASTVSAMTSGGGGGDGGDLQSPNYKWKNVINERVNGRTYKNDTAFLMWAAVTPIRQGHERGVTITIDHNDGSPPVTVLYSKVNPDGDGRITGMVPIPSGASYTAYCDGGVSYWAEMRAEGSTIVKPDPGGDPGTPVVPVTPLRIMPQIMASEPANSALERVRILGTAGAKCTLQIYGHNDVRVRSNLGAADKMQLGTRTVFTGQIGPGGYVDVTYEKAKFTNSSSELVMFNQNTGAIRTTTGGKYYLYNADGLQVDIFSTMQYSDYDRSGVGA